MTIVGGFAAVGFKLGLGDVLEPHVAGENLAIPQLTDDFHHFGPGGIEALVDLFVHLDRHDKFKLLGGHFTLLGRLAVVGRSAAGAATAFEAGGDAAFVAGAAFGAVVPGLLCGYLAAFEAGAAVDGAFAPVRAFASGICNSLDRL